MATGTAFALVDALTTERALSGNPAGVLLLDAYPDDAWLQGVANELQQAEIAFVVPGSAGQFHCAGSPRSLKSLSADTPRRPPSAHWLWEAGVLARCGRRLRRTQRDPHRCACGHEHRPRLPRGSARHIAHRRSCSPPSGHRARLDRDDRAPGADECNIPAVPDSEAAVRTLGPDLLSVSRLPAGGPIVTARRDAAGVVSRHFAPAYGISEVPVTGSAQCTIGPYWRCELGDLLDAEQASARGGHLVVQTTSVGRVLLRGAADCSYRRPDSRGRLSRGRQKSCQAQRTTRFVAASERTARCAARRE